MNWEFLTEKFCKRCHALERSGYATVLEMDIAHSAMLVALLQFAVSSNRLPSESEKIARGIANSIINAIEVGDPEISKALMLGWNNDFRVN